MTRPAPRRRRKGPVILGLAAAAVMATALVLTLDRSDDDAAPAPINPPPADSADLAMDTAAPQGISVEITYASVDEETAQVAVGAYVAGLVEDGGTCTAVFSDDDDSVTATSEGLADASTTTCGQLAVAADSLAPGTWSVEVTYDSPAGEWLASATTSVEAQ